MNSLEATQKLASKALWGAEATPDLQSAENQAILDNVVIGTVFLKNRVVQRCNSHAERLFGCAPGTLVGTPTRAWYAHPADYDAMPRDIYPTLTTTQTQAFDRLLRRQNGEVFWARMSGRVFDGENPLQGGTIWVIEDITERRRADEAIQQLNEVLEQRVRQRTAELESANLRLHDEIATRALMEQEMRRMAHYDSLTGLPNRNLLNDRIAQAIERAKRNHHKVGMLFIDLDHFKTINDTLGHHIGDLLLSQVASRMSFMLRAADTLGRLGGDEFLFLAPELDDPAKLAVIAAKFMEVLAQPIAVGSHMLHVTPSIGMCCYPDHGEDRETLMRNADTAMYFAKASGRNNFKFYTESLNADVDSRFQIENALRYALVQNEFSLHYQPLIDSRSNTVFGVEALLRWNSKTLGKLLPAQFISIAEESGLIIPIGAWALRQACMQVKLWREAHGRDYTLAVNLSPQQFRQPDLVQCVATLLAETGFPPGALELEITESSLMHNVSDVIYTLHHLVALGVHLAIDDFGTGYSSLSYLRHFPVHRLKIDQSFVRDIGVDERGLGIVTTIISLANTLGLEVIAEGVETQAQQDELMQQGCHFMQGYWFSRPLPVAQVEALLSEKAGIRGPI